MTEREANLHVPCPLVQRTLLAAALLLATVVGCSRRGDDSKVPTGTLRGTVTFEGKPIREGEISFLQEDTGGGATAQIDASGHFEVETPLQVGVYRVAVCPPTLRIPPGEPGAKVPLHRLKKYPNIPEFYHSEYSSDLRVEIEPGPNTVVVNMKRQSPPKLPKAKQPGEKKSNRHPNAQGNEPSVKRPGTNAAKKDQPETE